MARLNKKLLIPLAIFALALVARGLFFFEILHELPFNILTFDAREYFMWAKRIAGGHILSDGVFFTSPLYAYFLAAIFRVFGESLNAVRIIQMIMGSFVPVFIFFMTRRFFGSASAIAAGIIAAIYGPFIYYDALVLKTSLEIFLVSLGLVLLLRSGERDRWALWLASGIVWGFAIATKENNILFVPFIAAWLAIKDGRLEIKKTLRPFVIILAGIAIPIVPITAQNTVIGNDRVLIGYAGGANFYQGNFSGSDGINRQPDFIRADPRYEERDWKNEAELRSNRALKPSEISKFWFREGFKEIAANPLFFAQNTIRKIALVFNRSEPADDYPPDFYYQFSSLFKYVFLRAFFILSFGLFGLFLSLSGGDRRRAFLLISYIFVYATSLAAFHVNSRYRLPVILALIPFAAFGIIRVIEIVRTGEWKRARIIDSASAAIRDSRSAAIRDIWAFAICILIPIIPLTSFTQVDMSDNYNTLGQIELDGKYEEAAGFYRKAIETWPANPLARINLIEVLLVRGDAAGAKDAAIAAVKQFPGVDRYYLLYGIAGRASGKAAKSAREALREVYEREGITKEGISDDPDPRFKFLAREGLGELENRDYLAAIDAFSDAQKIKPDSASAAFLLAQGYELNGKAQQAIGEYRHVLAIEPMFLAARYNIAMNEFRRGNKNAALAELKIIRDIMPGFAETERYLGQ